MNRRDLLLAALAAGAAPVHAAAVAPAIARPGVQLYTVRSALQKDFRGTLAALAAMGCREVEFAGYFGRRPADLHALLRDLNLAAPSAHVGDDLFGPDAARVIDDALAVGHRYLVCPWVDAKHWRDLDGWQRRADAFNRAGELCRRAGVQFAYHNHHFEFATLGGQRPYDLLLARCEPALVQMELDVFWAVAARQDPLALLRTHPGRFPMLHLKQLKAPLLADGEDALTLSMDDAQRVMTDVGPGVIDFARLLRDPAVQGVRHCFVEHDAPQAPLQSVAASLRFLQGLA